MKSERPHENAAGLTEEESRRLVTRVETIVNAMASLNLLAGTRLAAELMAAGVPEDTAREQARRTVAEMIDSQLARIEAQAVDAATRCLESMRTAVDHPTHRDDA